MSRKKKCSECEKRTSELFDDNSDPPLDCGECLCKDCALQHIDDKIYDAEYELESLRKEGERMERA